MTQIHFNFYWLRENIHRHRIVVNPKINLELKSIFVSFFLSSLAAFHRQRSQQVNGVRRRTKESDKRTKIITIDQQRTRRQPTICSSLFQCSTSHFSNWIEEQKRMPCNNFSCLFHKTNYWKYISATKETNRVFLPRYGIHIFSKIKTYLRTF